MLAIPPRSISHHPRAVVALATPPLRRALLAVAVLALVAGPAPAAAHAAGGVPGGLPWPGGQQPIDFDREGIEGELPPASVASYAPGTDTSLCMSWEPTIAVDPNDPLVVAVSQFTTIQVSFDGGTTFPVTLAGPATNPGGDPSLAFDSQGNVFLTYLCSPGAGRDVCITGWSCDSGTASCSLLPGAWPVNVAAAAGVGGNNADKEWLAADSTPGSPWQDRLQVAWIRLDTNPWSVWTSFSTDQGQTWNGAQQLSAADEGTAWPCHVAVGPDGAAYVAWHAQGGFLDPSGGDVPDGVSGQIVLRRSDDGGANWQPRSFPYGPGQADMTFNVQHEANGLIPGANMWLFGSVQPWILPDPIVAGRVFVVQADDPDNDVDVGDAADVFIVTSNDSGASWSAPSRVDQGPPGSFQIMPTAAINPVNGVIGVAWYDSRAQSDVDLDGILELDFLATISLDGGMTWLPEIDVNDGRIDPAQATRCRFCGSDAVSNQNCGTMACPGPGTVRIGEYNGIAFGECTLHFAWADNATCGGDFDTFYDRDPALGGDFTPPAPACPPDVQVGCGDPTDPAATGFATATDDCDLDPGVTFSDEVLPGDCPPGSVVQVIRRTWQALDAAGNAAACQQEISVVDMGPPDLVTPAPLQLECNGPGGVAATDPAIVAFLASASAVDDCSVPSLANDAPALFPAGCPPGGAVTPVTFTATDDCGHETQVVVPVTVVDSTPPDVACSVATAVLWPPNHGLVDVGLEVVASDVCDEEPPAILIAVTSDEDPAAELGSGGPVHCPDAVVTEDGRLLLRAERAGTGDGRVYRIVVTAVDSCGNAAPCEAEVTVPAHPGPGGVAVDSGGAHDATACD